MAYNEKVIWDFFKSQGLSDTYCAAFIGNLWFESGQDLEYGSTCKEGAGTGASNSSQQYTNSVNNKSYSEYSFVNDAVGYGLAQWTYWSRKQGLYDYTVKNGLSIGDLETQLNYLVTEYEYKKTIDALNKLSPAEREDVDTCTRVVCEVFENPGIPHLDQRQTKANSIYKSYAGSSITTSTSDTVTKTPLVSTPQTVSAGEAIAAVALAEYQRYVDSNKASINRRGENANIYTEWAGTDTEWCAIFCSYCVDKAGVTWPVQQTQTDYGFASANPDIHQSHGVAGAAYKGGVFLDRNQFNQWQVGDIVCFDWGHVGIIVEIGTNYIVTIEGNGDNEGIGPSFGVTGWSGGEENHDDLAKRTMYVGDYRFNRIVGVMSFSGVSDVTLPSGSDLSYNSASTISSDQKLNEITYKEVQVDIKSSHIATADADANTLRTKSNSLLDTPTLVESPFIILKIGNYTFGSYSVNGSFDSVNSNVRVTYPNYMTSIRITKVNGQVNQYVITMVYQIENGNDPNLLDKIFSSVGYGTVYISYGDWNAPKFAYRDEEAIITRLDSNVDFSSSRIIYTLYCTSNALMLLGGYHNFTAGNVKPSEEIYRMMYAGENKYHLQDIFTAFKGNEEFFWKCVASDDVVVEVVPKIGMDALSYVNYLVTCMSPTTTPKGSAIRDANYYLTICEDRDLGTYFTVKKVSSTADIISLNNSDVYEVDVGYPGDTLVTQFKINSDNSWDLLYKYSESIAMPSYVYNIDAQGQIYESYSPNATTSAKYLKTTETQRNWWTQMTQFPIQATLTIKGLLRPAMLMSYVRINAMFYGLRHVSSGLYIIIKQEDVVDMTGYRTTLTLQRIAGDLDTIVTETRTVTKLVPEINYNVTSNDDLNWNTKNGSYGGTSYSSTGHQFTGGGRFNQPTKEQVAQTVKGVANSLADRLENPEDYRDMTDYMIP